MRIAILADPLDNQRAGVHSYTRMLIESLLAFKSRHEYLIVRQKHSDDFPSAETLVIPRSKAWPGLASYRLFIRVPQKLRAFKPDVVIETAHFGPWNLPPSVRRVTVIHDLSAIRYPHYHRWHSSFLQRLFLKGILKRTDLIIANSRFTAEDIARWEADFASKTTAIYPGRDSYFRPVPREPLSDEYGIEPPYFLYAGTLEPRKGLLTLLEAFEKFCRSGQPTRQLVLAGQMGWKTNPLRKALRSHPYAKDIRLTGYVPMHILRQLYTHCEAFIYPSEFEGFGFPIVEAMSCGAPVIAAKNSSLTEAGGDAARYFATGDAGALAAEMALLAGNASMRQSMKEASLLHAESFSRENFARKLTEALEKIVAEKSVL